jgi:hypothetical protein
MGFLVVKRDPFRLSRAGMGPGRSKKCLAVIFAHLLACAFSMDTLID